jgi:EAL domain-containing protein (putative c-di-GMP-specific phosphodiesterase class I)
MVWGEDTANDSIVRVIVDFAHTLGLTVTAKGVENDRQVASLMDMRCDMVQGFYASRPLSTEAVRPLVATNPTW